MDGAREQNINERAKHKREKRERATTDRKAKARMGVGVIMDDTSEYKKSKKLKEAEFP
ncbi:unnamed protein product [Arctogadus glacialis]